MRRNVHDLAAGRAVFTPDEWPAVQAMIDKAGYRLVERWRLDLNQPEAGWLPVVEEPVRRAPASVDIFEGLA